MSGAFRSPPLAVQPSFGHFFTRVNNVWIRGYESVKGSEPPLSNVVVVSITGGARDYQVPHYYLPFVTAYRFCLCDQVVLGPILNLSYVRSYRFVLECHHWMGLYLRQMG